VDAFADLVRFCTLVSDFSFQVLVLVADLVVVAEQLVMLFL